MGKHYNPLQKEFLIHQFKKSESKLSDFCDINDVSTSAFKKWLIQYGQAGLDGLVRTDAEIKEVLPEGVEKTEESYKREIIKLRIENERLKKNYKVVMNKDGEKEFIRLKQKNSE